MSVNFSNRPTAQRPNYRGSWAPALRSPTAKRIKAQFDFWLSKRRLFSESHFVFFLHLRFLQPLVCKRISPFPFSIFSVFNSQNLQKYYFSSEVIFRFRLSVKQAMEIAICGKLALSPNHVLNPKPGTSFIHSFSSLLIVNSSFLLLILIRHWWFLEKDHIHHPFLYILCSEWEFNSLGFNLPIKSNLIYDMNTF